MCERGEKNVKGGEFARGSEAVSLIEILRVEVEMSGMRHRSTLGSGEFLGGNQGCICYISIFEVLGVLDGSIDI
jgi:hypothetical protein